MKEALKNAGGSVLPTEVNWQLWTGLILVYLVFASFFGDPPFPKGPAWRTELLAPADNVQVREAERWLEGKASLPKRKLDTVLRDGKVYSHFPPLMTFLSAVVLNFSPDGVPRWLVTALFVWTVPGLAYRLFWGRCGRVWPAVVMTLAYVFGTSEFCILDRAAKSAGVYQLNHAISQVGLLLFLDGYFRRGPIWQSGVGLLIAGFSRLPTVVYALPMAVMAWSAKGRRRWLGIGFVVVLAGTYATLNVMKFGNPVQHGYGLIYEGREDAIALSAVDGAFHLKFVDDNLYWMNLGFPTFEEKHGQWRWVPSLNSTGIWWTTPLLLLVFWDLKRIWAERVNRCLLASVGIIYAVLMTYHMMGYAQRGYNRFSLDFLLVLLAMIAPYAFMGRRWVVSTLLAIWGVVYFRIILV